MKSLLFVTALTLAATGFAGDQPVPQKQTKEDTQTPEPFQTYIKHRRLFRWVFEFGADSTQTGNLMPQFRNIPASFRQVQGHPDDPWRGTLFTIPNNAVSIQRASETPDYLSGVNFSTGISFWDLVTLRGGVTIPSYSNGSADLSPREDAPDMPEINQTGSTRRGFGTALVYYSVLAKGSERTFTPFVEADFRVFRWISVFGGGWNATPITYVLERGYDRYDALERRSQDPFASQRMRYRYGGIRFDLYPGTDKFSMGWRVFVGKLHQEMKFVPGAEGVITGLPKDNTFIGGSFTLRFSLFSK